MYMNEYNVLMYVFNTHLLVDKRKVHVRNADLTTKPTTQTHLLLN